MFTNTTPVKKLEITLYAGPEDECKALTEAMLRYCGGNTNYLRLTMRATDAGLVGELVDTLTANGMRVWVRIEALR